MNFKKTLLLLTASFSLSACSFIVDNTVTNDASTGLYSFIEPGEDVVDINDYRIDLVNYKTLKDEDYNPYLTLSTYSSLLDNLLPKGYKFEVQSSSSFAVWALKNNNDQYTFISRINASEKSSTISGDISGYLTNYPDYSKSSLYIGSKNEYQVYGTNNPKLFSYSGTTYKTFSKGGELYIPLSLLEVAFAPYTGVNHLFTYNRLIQYDDYETFKHLEYLANGSVKTVFDEMKEYIDSEFNNVMPMYLRRDRLNSFLFTLDCLYGLKTTWKVPSISSLVNQDGTLDKFLSDSNLERTKAYARAFEILNDGHSGIRDGFSTPWAEGEFNYRGPTTRRMMEVRSELLAKRKAWLDGNEDLVHYSSDNKLAYFYFDSFSFAEEAYIDGNLRDDLYLEDTYFYFIKVLNQIKDDNLAKDVVIDISCNGGGVVGILMKLLILAIVQP